MSKKEDFYNKCSDFIFSFFRKLFDKMKLKISEFNKFLEITPDESKKN